ncbi:alpha/beta hydrolase [Leucobacter sp. G161]|uniref:alpha/beta hydrolase n=1 Tax=Leucobacter sp. G161 TaxID=663704 RepID=UPI000B186AA4|nr:alpha/beta hydrolase [Leucobacter sp. G161]
MTAPRTGTPRPEFDPELRASLAVVGGMFPPTITPDLLGFMRESYASPPIADTLAARGIERRDVTVPGHEGDPIVLSVLTTGDRAEPRVAVLFAHSGGLMFGDRFSGIDLALDWVTEFGAALITVEYRLAPEYPDPVPREDVYAALCWVHDHAAELGVRDDGILLAGASAGGSLVAGAALAARDRGGPPLLGQVLDYPMLDDRDTGHSLTQFDGVGVWDRVSNDTGWHALLGAARGGSDVSPYAAPARAADLGGLPPTFLTVGSAEIFRTETTAFAERIWQAGGNAELHVWPGAFHAADIFAPHTRVGRAMIQTRNAWVEHLLVG